MDNIKERKVSIIKSFRNRLIGITNEISDELSEIRSHWYDWYDKKIYDENSLNLLVASYSSSFNSLKILVEENDEFIDKNWNPNMHITDHDKNEINKLDFSASQMACLILPGTHDSSSLFSPLSSLLKKLKFDEKNAEFEGSLDVKQHRSPPRNKQKKQNEISQHEEQASLIEVKGDELTVKDVTENNDRQVVIFELRTSPSYQKKFLAFIVVFFLLLGVCFLFWFKKTEKKE